MSDYIKNCYTCKYLFFENLICEGCEVVVSYKGNEKCELCGRIKYESTSVFTKWEKA